MENVKKYMAGITATSGDKACGVFDPMNRLLFDCGEYGDHRARSIVETLNAESVIKVVSFWIEAEGQMILSELYKLGYRLLSHTTIIYDGMTINTVILKQEIDS